MTAFRTRGGATLALSRLGTGTAPLGNLYAGVDESDVDATFDAALATGSTYFDTSPFYGFGLAERRLGDFLRRRRADVVVSTKFGRLLRPGARNDQGPRRQWYDVPSRQIVFDYTYDGVMNSFAASLERLGLDRVAIFYCHDVDVWTHGDRVSADRRLREFLDSGRYAIEELADDGLIDAWGLGVNEWEVCERVADAAVPDIFLLAGRYSLLEQGALAFLDRCARDGIGIVIGGPYNSGILATGAVDGAWYNYEPAPPEILDRVRRIEAVCARHGVQLKDAALQFPLAHPAVVSVIPGAVSAAEVDGNAAALGAPIPAAFWEELKRDRLIAEAAPVAA